MRRSGITEGYVRMWPRALFERFEGERAMRASSLDFLRGPGVYVLYRDDKPYYIGQAQRLRNRLYGHARRPDSRYYHFWNFFSAFAVKNKKLRDEVEAILIAAMPTANSAKPKLLKEKMPAQVIKLLHEIYGHNKT